MTMPVFRRIRLMMTRRDLRRQQTIDDIKDTARRQLATLLPDRIAPGTPAMVFPRGLAISYRRGCCAR